MKIVSFNVNGVRARFHQLEELINTQQPDIIGLQEVKVVDDLFPHEFFEALGYTCYSHGQKGHYGVAFLSKIELQDVMRNFPQDEKDTQKRMISATVEFEGKPLRVFNGYFPQGESREHPTKFPNKQRFYAYLLEHLQQEHSPGDQVLLMGDMNVSPADIDIGIGDVNAKRWLKTGKCSFLPEEREWYQRLYDWGLVDSWRVHHPATNSIFSWFDYRSRGFDDNPKRGLRIDHILITQPLEKYNKRVTINYDIRAMDKPSDHCPVMIELG